MVSMPWSTVSINGRPLGLTDPHYPKQPINKGWLSTPPHRVAVINHLRQGGSVGVVRGPWNPPSWTSTGGDSEQVAAEYQPYFRYPSTTPGHAHLWYRVGQPPTGYQWSYLDAGGQILCDTRHCLIPRPEETIVGLYQALTRQTSGFRFPASILSPIPSLSPDSGARDTTLNLIGKVYTGIY